MKQQTFKIAIVEDDSYYRKLIDYSLTRLISTADFGVDLQVEIFSDPREIISEMDDSISIMILDYYLGTNYDHVSYTAPQIIDAAKLRCGDCDFLVISNAPEWQIAPSLKQREIDSVIFKDDMLISRIWGKIQSHLNAAA